MVGGIVVVVVVVVVAGGAVLLVGGTVGMVGSLIRSAVPCAVSPAPERNASMPAIDGTANSATSSAYSGRLAPRSRRVRGVHGWFPTVSHRVDEASAEPSTPHRQVEARS